MALLVYQKKRKINLRMAMTQLWKEDAIESTGGKVGLVREGD